MEKSVTHKKADDLKFSIIQENHQKSHSSVTGNTSTAYRAVFNDDAFK